MGAFRQQEYRRTNNQRRARGQDVSRSHHLLPIQRDHQITTAMVKELGLGNQSPCATRWSMRGSESSAPRGALQRGGGSEPGVT
jgi:hypothetical protein